MLRLRRLVIGLALAAASTVLCLLVVEGVARLSEEIRVRRTVSQLHQNPGGRFHPVLGWEKIPNHEQRLQTADFDVPFRVNSHGLRGPEREYAKPAGTRRVLILGDSFAEGYYVNEEATLRAVLERHLDPAGRGGCEVINGGTAAYSTDQEYLFYKIEGHRYGADVVVLMFYYNDLLNNILPADVGVAKPLFVLDRGELRLSNVPLPSPATNDLPGLLERVKRLKPWRGSIALRMLSRRTATSNPWLYRFLARFGAVPKARKLMPREMTVFGPGADVASMWHMTRAILRDLAGAAQAHGARLVILYVPAVFEVDDRAWQRWRTGYSVDRSWKRDSVFERLARVCASLKITLVDPRPALRQAQTSGAPAYYRSDQHWTEVGNRVGAEAVAPAVRSALACEPRR
jgi:lysophospholipase L1-like esterase